MPTDLPTYMWQANQQVVQRQPQEQSIPNDLVPIESPILVSPIDIQNLPNNMPKADNRQYQIVDYLQKFEQPKLKSVWGTQPNYIQKVEETKNQFLPQIDKLSNKQLDTALYIAEEANKRGINPGFAIAQAMHETFQKKNINTIFENAGGNLTGQKWSGPKDSIKGFSFLRTFETIPASSWIQELKNRPWIQFEKGTTKQSKLLQNVNNNTTMQLNSLLNTARKTNDWTKLEQKLNSFTADDKGNVHLSIRDRFKKFENDQEGIKTSLDLLKKKIQ